MPDLVLAWGHHLLAFGLVALLAAEFALVQQGTSPPRLRRLSQIDQIYGAGAALIILVGVLRVFYGRTGPDYFLTNVAFWLKMGAFALVGALSVLPTIRFIAWRRKAAADASYSPPHAEIAGVRRVMIAEAIVFAAIPLFAAAMMRP